ncbi:MAG: beta/gamma crystallin-related protein [Alphaproteobacteria bacterium]|jgi:hypothetical protein
MWRLLSTVVMVLAASVAVAMAGDGSGTDAPAKPCLNQAPASPGAVAPRWVTITLFRDTRFEGRGCTFDGDIPDLNAYAFAGVASSVRIQGGLWQLCERPHYRGFCIELERSQSDFNLFGFNDRARSLRRLR